MENLTRLLARLSPEADDLRSNASRVFEGSSLSEEQSWGVAIASALFIRHGDLSAALIRDAQSKGVSNEAIEDARGAAAIMGMNTVYFRFRHLMDSPVYDQKAVNLRMIRMKRVATTVENFELFSIGPAALSGCEMCLKAHEAALLKGGMNEDHVHDAVRISAVVNGVAVAFDTAQLDQ